MVDDNAISDDCLNAIVRVSELLSMPSERLSIIISEMANLSKNSNLFSGLEWIQMESGGYASLDTPLYRLLKISRVSAVTDCLAVGETKARRYIPSNASYLTASINNGLLERKVDGMYCRCRFSVKQIERNLDENDGVVIAHGDDWIDKNPCFGPLGRDYTQVRILADYDDVQRMLDTIREKCQQAFAEGVKSNCHLAERIKTMKEKMNNSINITVAGSGNQVAYGNGSITQQQATAKGMFATSHVGDVDSSSHMEVESGIVGILKKPIVVIMIICGLALIVSLLIWKTKNIAIEKDGAKVEAEFNDR